MGEKKEVLFLTNNPNTYILYDWLKERCQIRLYEGKLSLEQIREWNPELVISYNYKFILKNDIIEYMQGNIINLHISYLPWNKGSDPNVWSFIDETPKGVTIHQITEGLDKGAILYQRECHFDPSRESFATTYDTLNQTIVTLFQENWDEIKNEKYVLTEQGGGGSYHVRRELQELKEDIPFDWNDKIADFLQKFRDSGVKRK